MSTQLQQIETAIQHYFDGLYEGDVERLAQVFHPQASLFMASEGGMVVLPVPQWFERVRGRPSPASQQLPRADRILMVDLLGPANAVVKVECLVAPKAYTDYLSLIEIDGRWMVVAKAYCQSGTVA